jgi:endonuclease YncB( thermonuclease family)
LDENLALSVSTDVYKGRVMLTGLVKNAAARKRAGELARQVPAVQEIFNDLQISEDGGILVTLTDLFIENELKVKLVMAEGVSSINYRWRANNGTLHLLGAADNPDELAQVVRIARETDGVRKVVIHVISQVAEEPDIVVPFAQQDRSPGISIAQPTTADFLRGEVISVYNGDSFTVMIGRNLVKVRLIGSDAPEMTQSSIGRQARELLGLLVRGKMVRLETDDHRWDQEERLLAYVYVDDLFVNLELIRQGQAIAHIQLPNMRYGEQYRRAQTEAREAGRGVWKRP